LLSFSLGVQCFLVKSAIVFMDYPSRTSGSGRFANYFCQGEDLGQEKSRQHDDEAEYHGQVNENDAPKSDGVGADARRDPILKDRKESEHQKT
jgi:hypothetical protein